VTIFFRWISHIDRAASFRSTFRRNWFHRDCTFLKATEFASDGSALKIKELSFFFDQSFSKQEVQWDFDPLNRF
jgi:hypothetical protein